MCLCGHISTNWSTLPPPGFKVIYVLTIDTAKRSEPHWRRRWRCIFHCIHANSNVHLIQWSAVTISSDRCYARSRCCPDWCHNWCVRCVQQVLTRRTRTLWDFFFHLAYMHIERTFAFLDIHFLGQLFFGIHGMENASRSWDAHAQWIFLFFMDYYLKYLEQHINNTIFIYY